jgi:hypothetical protein
MSDTLLERMAVAFDEEMERQRAGYGWPLHPKPPLDLWPEDEKAAAFACFRAALRAIREPTDHQIDMAEGQAGRGVAMGVWLNMIDASA